MSFVLGFPLVLFSLSFHGALVGGCPCRVDLFLDRAFRGAPRTYPPKFAKMCPSESCDCFELRFLAMPETNPGKDKSGHTHPGKDIWATKRNLCVETVAKRSNLRELI